MGKDFEVLWSTWGMGPHALAAQRHALFGTTSRQLV
jgi:hypothetical protein